MKIILPKTLANTDEHADLPLFFLAGPILGAGDWQEIFCPLLQKAVRRDFAIAVPCRWKEGHPLYQHHFEGRTDFFHRQRAWERYYMTAASRSGGIIFWFGGESLETPRSDGNPYGMDTRREIGEWAARYAASLAYDEAPAAKLFIGVEEGGARFSGWDTIKYDLLQDDMLGNNFPINPTMQLLAEEVAQCTP